MTTTQKQKLNENLDCAYEKLVDKVHEETSFGLYFSLVYRAAEQGNLTVDLLERFHAAAQPVDGDLMEDFINFCVAAYPFVLFPEAEKAKAARAAYEAPAGKLAEGEDVVPTTRVVPASKDEPAR